MILFCTIRYCVMVGYCKKLREKYEFYRKNFNYSQKRLDHCLTRVYNIVILGLRVKDFPSKIFHSSMNLFFKFLRKKGFENGNQLSETRKTEV